MNDLTPMVSTWYLDTHGESLFEVVAFDEESGYVECQGVDGEVGEYDLSTWRSLNLKFAEAPEDCNSSYEISSEDKKFFDDVIVPDNFSGALTNIEPEFLDQFEEDY